MSTSTLVQYEQSRTTRVAARLVDYAELTKPRILGLVLVTVTLTAVIATWGQPDLTLLLHTLVGTTLVAGSASMFNQWLEQNRDGHMRRTADRPLPAGRLGRVEVALCGMLAVLVGLAYLLNTVGRTATFWAAGTWLIYVCVYTPLKSRTWLNTLVGAFPGAMPILIGWTAMGVELDIRAWCLFLLVFCWQFPHFMAIAWIYRQQYAQAGMRMLTVVDPTGRRAGNQAVAAAISVLLISLVPAAVAMQTSVIYLLATVVLGLAQLRCAIGFWRQRDDVTSRRLLRASLIYLPLQLALITLLNLALI